MMLNIDKEVAAMERMTVDQLRAKYAEVFGEPTNGRHKQWLIKRIAWRLQANAEGGPVGAGPPAGDGTGQRRRPAADAAAGMQARDQIAVERDQDRGRDGPG